MKKSIDHQEVNRLYINGYSIEKISELFGIHRKSTMRILRGYGHGFERKYIKVSCEDVVSAIQKFYNENKTLSVYEYSKLKYKPSVTKIKSLFGSWENAISQAGFDASGVKVELNPQRKIYTRDEILEKIKTLLSTDEEIIKRKVYIERKYEPSVNVIISHFGSWRNMLLELGIDVNTKGIKSK